MGKKTKTVQRDFVASNLFKFYYPDRVNCKLNRFKMVYRYTLQPFSHRTTKRAAGKYIINQLPKTYNDCVYPRLPFLIREKRTNIKVGESFGNNLEGQLRSHARTVTALVRHERIVLHYRRATEVRMHVERLIVEAMRNGDCHRPTMALADFWLLDKQLIHKLFKELVPRYSEYSSSFTALHFLGVDYDKYNMTLTEIKEKSWRKYSPSYKQVVLELRGNHLPPITRPKLNKAGLLTNVLLDGARESRRFEAQEAIAAATSS